MLDDPALLPRGGVWTTKFLHSPSLRIAGGSDQIQGNIIGERVLGLPPRPAPTATCRSATSPRPFGRFRADGHRRPAHQEPGGAPPARAARRARARAPTAATTPCRCATSRRPPRSPSARSTATSRRRTRCSPPPCSSGWRTWSAGSPSGRRAATPPPSASTTCCAAPSRTMERQPKLAEAVITALTSDDREAGAASVTTTDVMQRVLLQAFPEGTDPELEADIAKVLGHVWFSCLVAWSNGVGDLTWVGEELETATHLLCDHLELTQCEDRGDGRARARCRRGSSPSSSPTSKGPPACLRRLGDRYSALLDRHLELMARGVGRARRPRDRHRRRRRVRRVPATPTTPSTPAPRRSGGSAPEPWPADGALRARMGVHTGPRRADRTTTTGRWPSTRRPGSCRRPTAARCCCRRPPSTASPRCDSTHGDRAARAASGCATSTSRSGCSSWRATACRRDFPAVRARPGRRPQPRRARHVVPWAASDELADVLDRLGPGRLVTLAGPGRGRQDAARHRRSASQVADDWPDGAWLVDLGADRRGRARSRPIVADALGVPGPGRRPVGARCSITSREQAGPRDPRQLRERSPTTCARLLEELLARCPACGVLATSRVPLGTPRRGPLPRRAARRRSPPTAAAGAAVDLFLDRVVPAGAPAIADPALEPRGRRDLPAARRPAARARAGGGPAWS